MAQKSILIIDDTPENIDLLAGILKPEFTVKAATSGRIGLKIASSRPPDLILLDIRMPEMDGFEVCQTLKTEAGTAGIPVLFLSADAGQKEQDRAEQLGAEGVLEKPVDASILKRRIAELMPD